MNNSRNLDALVDYQRLKGLYRRYFFNEIIRFRDSGNLDRKPECGRKDFLNETDKVVGMTVTMGYPFLDIL